VLLVCSLFLDFYRARKGCSSSLDDQIHLEHTDTMMHSISCTLQGCGVYRRSERVESTIFVVFKGDAFFVAPFREGKLMSGTCRQNGALASDIRPDTKTKNQNHLLDSGRDPYIWFILSILLRNLPYFPLLSSNSWWILASIHSID
jgi:hypothetical protein